MAKLLGALMVIGLVWMAGASQPVPAPRAAAAKPATGRADTPECGLARRLDGSREADRLLAAQVRAGLGCRNG